MIFTKLFRSRSYGLIIVFIMLVCVSSPAIYIAPVQGQASQILHDTKSEFARGSFNQTTLEGTEYAPEIKLGTNTTATWFFQDDDISGWTFSSGGDTAYCMAEESPPGQIHLKAQYVTQHSFAVAMRSDVAIPTKLVAEWRVVFDNISASGVSDPRTQYPTGASFRFRLRNPTACFWIDVFTDRILSIWTPASYVYNTTDYLDVVTNVGTWYTFRFEVDFTTLKSQIYRDDGSGFILLGQLAFSTQNQGGNEIFGGTAYVATAASTISEGHIDFIRLGTETASLYDSGTYTSESLLLNATGFGSFVWLENKQAWPYPWGQWAKYAGNPVLSTGSPAENFLIDVGNSTPIAYDGKYWLVFPSGSGVGLAYTTDPQLFTGWTSYPSNPVLSPMAGENSLSSPCLVRIGSLYYLFFDVWQPGIWERGLGYATANAPTGPWTRGTDPNGQPYLILTWGPPGSWDDSRVAEPYLFKEGDTYYMYYMGDRQPYAAKEEIGVATTSAADFPLGPGGGNWTKYAGNPVLPHNPDPSSWDHWLCADPSVIKVGSRYYLHYTGSAIYGGYQGWKLGIAYADSPFGPWTRPSSPTLDVGPPGSWDSNKLVRGSLHYLSGKCYIIYDGESGSGWRQGIATADPYVDQEYVQFETRTSADNSSWEDWRPVLNGSTIQSTPDKYFQYRATLNNSALGTPVLTSVTIDYQMAHAHSIYIDPSLVERNGGDIGTCFNVNITVEDVSDLFGFDLNITWDNSMIALTGVEFTTRLDEVWGQDHWFCAFNSTGSGWYALSAVSLSTGFTTTGAKPLATLQFFVENAPAGETPIHFAMIRLGSSGWKIIPIDEVRDGTYRLLSSIATIVKTTPALIEKTCSDIGTYFNVTVTLQNVTALFGFDFNVTWDNSLLTYNNCYYASTLDTVWSAGNWLVIKNDNGAGWFKFVALSTKDSFNTTGSQSMFIIEFRIEDPHTGSSSQTSIHFATHKLSDSKSNPIIHSTQDGTYRIAGKKPTIQMTPTSKICRKYGETFTINVNVSDADSVEDFKFEIHYNTTLLDYVNIVWNAWSSGTAVVDEANGNLTGFTSGSPLNGTITLVTVQFNAAYHRIWKNITGWTNDQSGLIFFQWANLSYPSPPDLRYERGGLNEINMGPDVMFTFSPIQGDIDNNGVVDIFDLRTLAAYYDEVNPQYNLMGSDLIDIYDLALITANFNYQYSP